MKFIHCNWHVDLFICCYSCYSCFKVAAWIQSRYYDCASVCMLIKIGCVCLCTELQTNMCDFGIDKIASAYIFSRTFVYIKGARTFASAVRVKSKENSKYIPFALPHFWMHRFFAAATFVIVQKNKKRNCIQFEKCICSRIVVRCEPLPCQHRIQLFRPHQN